MLSFTSLGNDKSHLWRIWSGEHIPAFWAPNGAEAGCDPPGSPLHQPESGAIACAAMARVILGSIEMIHMMRKRQEKYTCNWPLSFAGQFALLVA